MQPTKRARRAHGTTGQAAMVEALANLAYNVSLAELRAGRKDSSREWIE